MYFYHVPKWNTVTPSTRFPLSIGLFLSYRDVPVVVTQCRGYPKNGHVTKVYPQNTNLHSILIDRPFAKSEQSVVEAASRVWRMRSRYNVYDGRLVCSLLFIYAHIVVFIILLWYNVTFFLCYNKQIHVDNVKC